MCFRKYVPKKNFRKNSLKVIFKRGKQSFPIIMGCWWKFLGTQEETPKMLLNGAP